MWDGSARADLLVGRSAGFVSRRRAGGSSQGLPARLQFFHSADRRTGRLAASGEATDTSREMTTMLRWALIFLVFALIAAFFGFGGIAAASAGIAKTLFFVFLVVFVVTLLLGVAAGRKVL
jgi:uncharacterized membrane protein YtjA (UPF0391 family)